MRSPYPYPTEAAIAEAVRLEKVRADRIESMEQTIRCALLAGVELGVAACVAEIERLKRVLVEEADAAAGRKRAAKRRTR